MGRSNIVSQLPEKTRRKFIDKDTKVKDWETYCQFVSDVNGALREDPEYKKTIERPIGAINKYQNNQNTNNQPNTSGNQHYSSSGFQQNRKPQNYQNQSYNQNKTSHQQGGERRLSRYEQKYDVCGRCLGKGHYRYECKNKPKCSICKRDTHEFYSCPDRRQQRNNSSFLARN